MIQTINLCKSYRISGQVIKAADRVNISISTGELVAIIGHSGSGKTTLLSLLGGLTKPDSGQVLIEDLNLWSMNDSRLAQLRNKRFGFIYQFASLIPTLTALENLYLPTAFGKGYDDLKNRAMDLLQKVGMNDKADFYPSQLSGGQQRRVSIARAFINNPEIILADEPTGDLDEETEAEIIDLFKTMNQERGTTFIIVTHNKSIAQQAQRNFSMRDGDLQEN
ncbi:MAG: ABC transporter ATP-binding protein [Proteobacteria bacterium]|nr:ABC transporter ATP-binding protein [Pseudomonadota bacterium]MBU1686692.1 ABC transporter ATP-binding protein [Pseudomonadota bacterium]